MGSSPDKPRHTSNETQHRVVTMHGVWLGKYPIIQMQWLAHGDQSFWAFNIDYLDGGERSGSPGS